MDSSFVQDQLEPKATYAERQIISLHLFSVQACLCRRRWQNDSQRSRSKTFGTCFESPRKGKLFAGSAVSETERLRATAIEVLPSRTY
jgi:hypothetical protein